MGCESTMNLERQEDPAVLEMTRLTERAAKSEAEAARWRINYFALKATIPDLRIAEDLGDALKRHGKISLSYENSERDSIIGYDGARYVRSPTIAEALEALASSPSFPEIDLDARCAKRQLEEVQRENDDLRAILASDARRHATLPPGGFVTVDGEPGMWTISADGTSPCAACEDAHQSYDTLHRHGMVGVLYHVCERRVRVVG